MSAGPADTAVDADAGPPRIAGSAVVIGTARLGEAAVLAEGAVIRSHRPGVEVGAFGGTFIGFVDKAGVNQDGCRGATVTLAYGVN